MSRLYFIYCFSIWLLFDQHDFVSFFEYEIKLVLELVLIFLAPNIYVKLRKIRVEKNHLKGAAIALASRSALNLYKLRIHLWNEC